MRVLGIVVLLIAVSASAQTPTVSVEQLRPKTKAPYKVHLIWHKASIYNQQHDRTCVIVFPDGRFHMERGDLASKPKDDKVYEGTLTPEQETALQSLLADPQLPATSTNIPLGQVIIHQSETLIANISRPDGLHTFGFMSNDGRPPFTPSLRSLASWTEGLGKGVKPTKGATPNKCLPS